MTSARVVGRLAAVRGPAGVQRSGMLCARDARDRGVAVLRARCDELAMQSGFVAVRELLWGEVHRDWAYFAGPAQLAAHLVMPEGAGYEGPARSGRRAPSFALADVESRSHTCTQNSTFPAAASCRARLTRRSDGIWPA